jgi:uracil-DNA glycosylase family 4
MRIEHELIACDCKISQCPVYSKCCYLPTEVHPDTNGGVSILFVGQGGGRDERKLGRPFIGRAGKRIRQQVTYARRKLEKHIGVAFSNTIRDNPEDNRIPTSEELDICLPFLYRDIAELKRRGLRVVIPLGNAAKGALIAAGAGPMSKDRGQLFRVSKDIFGEIFMLPTYHPSYVMRNVPNFNEGNPSPLDIIVVQDIIKAYELSFSAPVGDSEPEIHIDNELLF